MKRTVQKKSRDFSPFAASELGRGLTALQATSSPSNRAVAAYLLHNPVRVAACSIEELSGQIAVSPATVSRFARTAGFKGYPELRAAIAESLQSVLRPVEKLREALDGGGAADSAALGQDAMMQNLRDALEGLSAQALRPAVDAIRGARTVYVMGFGLSAHVAGLLTLGLQPFCPQLINVVEFGGTEVAAGRLMNVGEGDLLIAITFPRYARDVIHLAKYARDRGARVVAITDGPTSPLARIADHLLVAPTTHPVLSSSAVATVAVAEALVAALMTADGRNVAQAARLTEAIAGYLHQEREPVRRLTPRRKR